VNSESMGIMRSAGWDGETKDYVNVVSSETRKCNDIWTDSLTKQRHAGCFYDTVKE
jgi:hypothetical protein